MGSAESSPPGRAFAYLRQALPPFVDFQLTLFRRASFLLLRR